MRVAAVIPARMASTRLPGKPLTRIAGVPMIVRVLERARLCRGLSRIIVATDSPEIGSVVEQAGGEFRLTAPDHPSGSDRVAEVAAGLHEELVLNLQGDEPLLPTSTVAALLDLAEERSNLRVATAKVALSSEADIANPNIVKVVTDRNSRALYFSRFPIPFRRVSPGTAGAAPAGSGHFKHIGIYLYRREFLLEFVRMEPTPLERLEALEQLRILEHGFPIDVVEVQEDSVSVDTPDDIQVVESLIRASIPGT